MPTLPPHSRPPPGLGYVPQGREIFPRLTVEENLKLGLATRFPGTPIPRRIFDIERAIRRPASEGEMAILLVDQ